MQLTQPNETKSAADAPATVSQALNPPSGGPSGLGSVDMAFSESSAGFFGLVWAVESSDSEDEFLIVSAYGVLTIRLENLKDSYFVFKASQRRSIEVRS